MRAPESSRELQRVQESSGEPPESLQRAFGEPPESFWSASGVPPEFLRGSRHYSLASLAIRTD
eukprot:11065137-Alexandrium_andersonii.AAC.1